MPTTKQTRPKEKAEKLKAEPGREIFVKTVNEIGVLAEISKTVAEKGVSILAVSAWVEGVNGIVRLVTDDNLRAGEALRKKNFDVREGRVVLVEVPHKPGLLKHMTEKLRTASII